MKRRVSVSDIKFAQVLFLARQSTECYKQLHSVECVCVVSYEVFYQQAIEGLVS